MNKNLKIKISIDIIMTILMLLEMAYQLTGNLFHEITGVTLFVLFFLHNMLNIKWYKAIYKGKYNLRRIISTAVNVFLLSSMILLMITGIMISKDVFTFLEISGGLEVRELHTFAAAWGLVFMSVHVGMHWQMLINMTTKITEHTDKKNIVTIIMRLITVGIVAYGIKSFFDLDMSSKLFMQTTFSYWNFDESTIGFFLSYLSIMGIYIAVTYYLLALTNKFHK